MIFAAFPWLAVSTYTLMAVFGIVCVLMCMIILMQRPKNEGLGAAFGSGTTDQLFGARTTNVLQKMTTYLGTMFFVLVLTLAILLNQQPRTGGTLVKETTPATGTTSDATTTTPGAPVTTPDTTPKTEDTKTLEPETAPQTPAVDPATVPPAPPAPAPEQTAPPAEPAKPTEEKPAEEPK